MPSLQTGRLPNRLRLLGKMTRTEEDLEQEARVAHWQGKSPGREALRWWKKYGRTIRIPGFRHDRREWDEYPDATSLDMLLSNAEETGNRRGLGAIAVDGVEDEALGMTFWAGVIRRAGLSELQLACLQASMTGEPLTPLRGRSLYVARRKIRRVLVEIQAEERALLEGAGG